MIRRAVEADAGQVSDLLTGSWHRTYDKLMGVEHVNEMTLLAHARAKLMAEFKDPSLVTLVATDPSGVVAGVAKADLRPDRELYLDRLHIEPATFGTGLADQLLTAVIAHGNEPLTVTLEVLAGNDRAIAYYLKRGFIESAKLDACGTALGVPTILMTRAE